MVRKKRVRRQTIKYLKRPTHHYKETGRLRLTGLRRVDQNSSSNEVFAISQSLFIDKCNY